MSDEPHIVYERGENGWWIASIPAVHGAFSQGRTKAEARRMVLDALSELLVVRAELDRSRAGNQ